jgi:hypothetical protein
MLIAAPAPMPTVPASSSFAIRLVGALDDGGGGKREVLSMQVVTRRAAA